MNATKVINAGDTEWMHWQSELDQLTSMGGAGKALIEGTTDEAATVTVLMVGA